MKKIEKLFRAIRSDNADKVSKLLRSKFFGLIKPRLMNSRHNEEYNHYYDYTPLMAATLYNSEEIIRLLIEKGADIDFVNEEGSSALSLAILFGRLNIFKYLLKHRVKVNTTGEKPMNLACRRENPIYITMLLEKGANINTRDRNGDNALKIAVEDGNLQMVKLLISHGANVKQKYKSGITLLTTSIINGINEEIITLLIENGLNINEKDKIGRTPAIVAVQEIEDISIIKKVIKLLDEHGANLDDKDKNGNSANDYLFLKENNATINTIKQYVEDLDLPASELSFYNPLTETAMEELPKMGDLAFRYLVMELEKVNPTIQGRIIFILQEMNDIKGIPVIARYLDSGYEGVQLDALEAMDYFFQQNQLTSEAIDKIAYAARNSHYLSFREKAADLLSKIGMESGNVPWFFGAETFEEIADNFIRSQIKNEFPDYSGLLKACESLIPEEQHGVWIRVAGEIVNSDKQSAIKCYIQALACDPDPNSLAWVWLNGSQDPEINVLPSDGEKDQQVIKKLQEKWHFDVSS